MTQYLIGLGLFIGAHTVLVRAPIRATIAGAVGDNGFKGVMTVLSLAGLVLAWRGFSEASVEPVYEPIDYDTARALAHGVMPLAAILFVAAYIPGNIKRWVRHPQSISVLIWAAVHLAGNGDVRSVALFGSFAVFVTLSMALAKPAEPRPRAPLWIDAATVVAGLVLYGFLIWAHRVLGGVAVVG